MAVYCINHLNNYQAAADEVKEVILESLPLRGLALSFRASAVGANIQPEPVNMAPMVGNIEVILGGTTLWQTSLLDAMNLQAQILGRSPFWFGNAAADNSLAMMSCFLPFGRKWGSGPWAIPPTAAGQLRLRLTLDIAVANYDVLSCDVDGIYDDGLPNQAVTGHLRTTTYAAVPAATGDFTLDLPVGRYMAALGVFETTFRTTQAGANGINTMKLLRDGVEIRYPLITQQNARLLSYLTGSDLGQYIQHRHVSDVAAAYTQFQATQQASMVSPQVGNSYWLDFDPEGDGSGMLDLRSCNRLQLRLNMGIAEAFRVQAVEWWPNTAQGSMALPSGMM